MNAPKKIVFVTSLFSGIEKTFIHGKWEPHGMPAVYKLLEVLQERNYLVDYYAITKKRIKLSNKVKSINVIGIREPEVLKITKNVVRLIFELYVGIRVGINCLQKKDYVVYCDRANVVIGALLSLVKIPVILRLHGTGLLAEKFQNPLYRLLHCSKLLAYRAPFRAVIITNDGTPANIFAKKYICETIPVHVKCNGIDTSEITPCKKHTLPIKVLYVSRLERSKGIYEFLQIATHISSRKKIRFKVIGKIPEKEKATITRLMEDRKVDYCGVVAHSSMKDFYEDADVFISFNKLGNLCNTVLEAVNLNTPIITFAPDYKSGRDIETKKILKHCSWFVTRNKCVNESVAILTKIIENPEVLYSKHPEVDKKQFSTWEQRCNWELTIINKCMSSYG